MMTSVKRSNLVANIIIGGERVNHVSSKEKKQLNEVIVASYEAVVL